MYKSHGVPAAFPKIPNDALGDLNNKGIHYSAGSHLGRNWNNHRVVSCAGHSHSGGGDEPNSRQRCLRELRLPCLAPALLTPCRKASRATSAENEHGEKERARCCFSCAKQLSARSGVRLSAEEWRYTARSDTVQPVLRWLQPLNKTVRWKRKNSVWSNKTYGSSHQCRTAELQKPPSCFMTY